MLATTSNEGVIYQDQSIACDALGRVHDVEDRTNGLSITTRYDAMNRELLADGVAGTWADPANIRAGQGHVLACDKDSGPQGLDPAVVRALTGHLSESVTRTSIYDAASAQSMRSETRAPCEGDGGRSHDGCRLAAGAPLG